MRETADCAFPGFCGSLGPISAELHNSISLGTTVKKRYYCSAGGIQSKI